MECVAVRVGRLGVPVVVWLKQRFKFSRDPSPGIVLPPLRFYEAAITGRANSKRPESTMERWEAVGA